MLVKLFGLGALTLLLAGACGGADSGGGDGGAPPSGACRSDDDCSQQSNGDVQQCVSPGDDLGCGACDDSPAECQVDKDCGDGKRCGIDKCKCSGGGSCVPGCTSDHQCGKGAVCDAMGHCEPAHCSSDGDCDPTFSCKAQACARRSCNGDDDCGGGVCVNDACFDGFGACEELPD